MHHLEIVLNITYSDSVNILLNYSVVTSYNLFSVIWYMYTVLNYCCQMIQNYFAIRTNSNCVETPCFLNCCLWYSTNQQPRLTKVTFFILIDKIILTQFLSKMRMVCRRVHCALWNDLQFCCFKCFLLVEVMNWFLCCIFFVQRMVWLHSI